MQSECSFRCDGLHESLSDLELGVSNVNGTTGIVSVNEITDHGHVQLLVVAVCRGARRVGAVRINRGAQLHRKRDVQRAKETKRERGLQGQQTTDNRQLVINDERVGLYEEA